MQRIITLILALALYAPNVAGIFAYSKCEVEAVINKLPDCDCQLTSVPQPKHQDNVPNRHKEIVQQTDWKYIISNQFASSTFNDAAISTLYQSYQSPYHSCMNETGIFRPPCC